MKNKDGYTLAKEIRERKQRKCQSSFNRKTMKEDVMKRLQKQVLMII